MKPIKREKAEKLLNDLLCRVKLVNEDEQFLHEVTELGVFGSFITDAERVGDVDIYIEYRPKGKFLSDWPNDAIDLAKRSGKSFSSYVEMLSYPARRLMIFLKNRSPYLSFHSKEEVKRLGIKYQLLVSL